jgi:hypothetical protein
MKGWNVRRVWENSGWWTWWNHGNMRRIWQVESVEPVR